jgi:hypothetical protein
MNKKYFLATAFSITSVIGGLFAQGDVESRLSQLEKEMSEVGVKNAMGTFGAQYADSKAVGNGWKAEIDVLLWHAKAGGVDWAIVFDNGSFPLDGRMRTLGFGWDWGVRVGASKKYDKDGWEGNALYTYFSTHDSNSVSKPFATVDDLTGGTASGSTSAKYNGEIHYNAVDLNLGRQTFVSKQLCFYPSAGLKAVWIDQTYRLSTVNKIDASTTSIPVSGGLNTNLRDKCDVFGIGPAVGIDSSWHLCNNLRILGNASYALLQGYYKVTQYERIVLTPSGSVTTDTSLNQNGDMHRLFPHARLLLGLGWEKCFNEGRQLLDLSLSYETNYFWRVNQTINDVDTTPNALTFLDEQAVRINMQRTSEDLCFYGVTLKATLRF